MVYTLIDHKMTSENVQNFTAKFWTFYGVILWSIRVWTIENCCRFVFYDNMEKVRAELAIFSVEKARVLHLTSFLLSVLL